MTNIGNAWTKTEEKDGKKVVTGISVTLDEGLLELFPALKTLKFVLKPIPAEQRTKEKFPHWRVVLYKPQEQAQAAQGAGVESIGDEEIPF